MGFFSRIFGGNTPNQNFYQQNNQNQSNSGISSLNLNKEQSLQQLNLRKAYLNDVDMSNANLRGARLTWSTSIRPLPIA